MRQYRVYFRSKTAEEWATLEPGAHVGIYDNPAVNAALQVIRDQPAIEGVVCRHDGNLFNVIAFEQEALAPKSFILGETT